MKINKKFINGAVVIEAFFIVIILLAWLTYNEKADNDEKYY